MHVDSIKEMIFYQGGDKSVFRKVTFEVLKNISDHVYPFYWNHDDNYYNDKNLDFMTAVNPDSFPIVVFYVRKSFIDADMFFNNTVEGICFRNKSGLKGMVFTPTRYLVSRDKRILNRNFYNKTYLDIKHVSYMPKLFFLDSFECFPLALFYESIISVLSYELDISVDKFLVMLYENTLHLYLENYNKIVRNEATFKEILNKKNISHTEIFSSYYYLLLKILKHYLPANGIYTFHDVGTELACLPAMILDMTARSQAGINISKIIASDCVPQQHELLIWMQKYNDLPHNIDFRFNFLDLLDSDSKPPVCDITVSIDVLEHLPDEETAKEGLLKLWDMTKEVLIVHVPIETKENKWHDHNMLFDKDKISQWAAEIPGSVSLEYFRDNNDIIDLPACGFLILFREQGSADVSHLKGIIRE
ncbi:MAG: hypothetical protein JXK07_14865 [Spirochaetes bacterium]|nr:hypothetical protein [Spirochaetota bacterium]MBN2769937.1 hypothetical protein [Spirochaetota bacterium]